MGEGGAYASTPFLKEPCTFVLLSAALCRPGRDQFYVEDEEMLEELVRILSGKGMVCADPEEIQLQELATRGESLIQGAGDGDSQTEEFRSLFLDTWQTLRETVTAWGVTPKAVALFVGLAQEYRRADYDRGYDFYE